MILSQEPFSKAEAIRSDLEWYGQDHAISRYRVPSNVRASETTRQI